jgi:hypothetical protein
MPRFLAASGIDAQPELDAALAHDPCRDAGRLRIEHPRHQPAAPAEHRHPDAEIGEQEGDLHPDEPGADDQGRPDLAAPDAVEERPRRPQRLEVVDVPELVAWDVGVEAAARGDDEPAEWDG